MDIPHVVTCPYCNEKFDRDKEKYVKVSSRRYAHAACALQQAKGKEIEIIDPTDQILCLYCRKPLRKQDEDCVKISETRFAHKECKDKEDARPKTAQEEFYIYVANIFDLEFIPPPMQKQATKYIENYGYSYSGMQKALSYFLNIKKGKIDTSHHTLGIIPYVYNEAYNYYYRLWEAQKKNESKDIIKPKVKVIVARRPQVKIKKPKFFSFLDEED